ncbi:hypothetical protein ACIQCD_23480 [Streptomyces sp. NPDC093250]|uniref:hypothetical protein n=1 Tax=unclassified Streptomyces TaxID=2593676 RepID=UPI0033CED90A
MAASPRSSHNSHDTTREPIVLTPQYDEETDSFVFTRPDDPVSGGESVLDVRDVELVPGQSPALVHLAESPEGQRIPLSRLPQERMASGEQAASWEDVRSMIEEMERNNGPDVELVPGGGFVRSDSSGVSQEISKIPQERMAAINPGPTQTDIDLLSRLDPHNVEKWQPVVTSFLTGWKFQMQPPCSGQLPFVFFAFRSPSDGNAFRITPIRPNLDNVISHKKHMYSVKVGGQSVSVLCGPGGRSAADLAEVRTHAAKWMAYTSLRMAGRKPRFSR